MQLLAAQREGDAGGQRAAEGAPGPRAVLHPLLRTRTMCAPPSVPHNFVSISVSVQGLLALFVRCHLEECCRDVPTASSPHLRSALWVAPIVLHNAKECLAAICLQNNERVAVCEEGTGEVVEQADVEVGAPLSGYITSGQYPENRILIPEDGSMTT